MPKQKETRFNIGKTTRVLLNNECKVYPGVLREFIIISDRKNKLHLNAFLKKNILKRLGIKNLDSSFIDVSIYRYIKQDIMVQIGEGSFLINPLVSFKCSNQEFITLVQQYENARTIALANIKKGSRFKKDRKGDTKPLPKPRLVDLHEKK